MVTHKEYSFKELTEMSIPQLNDLLEKKREAQIALAQKKNAVIGAILWTQELIKEA